MKTLTVRAEPELLDEFKELCALNDRTQAQEVRDFIRSYVKKNRKLLEKKEDDDDVKNTQSHLLSEPALPQTTASTSITTLTERIEL